MLALRTMLKPGDKAPDFAVNDHLGRRVSLADLLAAGKTVVLWFYPKADTPGCTREGCGFRDQKAAFDAKNAVIYGVSFDTQEENKAFAEKFSFNFPLLSDTDKQVAKAYGVLNFTRLFANRVTFVIDPEGVIRHIEQGGDAIDPAGAVQACPLPKRQ